MCVTNGNEGQLRLPTLVDIETVARHLGVEVRHVRRLVAEDRIPYVKWGRLLRFDLDEIAAWIDANRHTPHLPAVADQAGPTHPVPVQSRRRPGPSARGLSRVTAGTLG